MNVANPKKPTSAILQRPPALSEPLKSTSLEFSAFQGIHILPSNAVFHFFLIVLIWQITQVPHPNGIMYLRPMRIQLRSCKETFETIACERCSERGSIHTLQTIERLVFVIFSHSES